MIKPRHIFKLGPSLTLLVAASASAYGDTLPDISSFSNIKTTENLEATTADKSTASQSVSSGEINSTSKIDHSNHSDHDKDTQEALVGYRAAIKELDENGPYHEQSSEALYGLAQN